MNNNQQKHKKGLGTLMVALTLLMASTTSVLASTPIYASTISTQSSLPKTLPASDKVIEVIKYDSPILTTNAKPATHVKMEIDGKQQTMTDPMLMENNRVFLPLRNVGELLGVNVDYLKTEKIAVAYNEKAYLELPIGYNTAVKDQTILLPVDANVKDTRIFTYNNKTYLPVRFVAENLGYQISYTNNTVIVNTKGDTPDVPSIEGEEYVSKMNPSDPTNIYNLQALKEGRSLSVMPTAPISSITKPQGMSNQVWTTYNKLGAKVVLATAKLSDLPKDINVVMDGKENFAHDLTTVPRITVNNKGLLQSSRGGAPTYIFFKDGTVAMADEGGDVSVGMDPDNHKINKPGKGIKDIACITIADTQAKAEYIIFINGK